MSRDIGPKEAAARAMREARYEVHKKQNRAIIADLKTATDAIPIKRRPKIRKKKL